MLEDKIKFSYHDVEVEFNGIREKIFNLPFNLMLTCTRVGGWELWESTVDTVSLKLDYKLIAGEYNETPLKIYVDGIQILG